MDIFTFAMEKEKYAEKYYRDLAEKTDSTGLKNILLMLADDEVKHYNIVKTMKEEHPDVQPSEVIRNSKKIFSKMKNAKEKFNFSVSHIDLYKKAQTFEKNSELFYAEQAARSENKSHKEIFLKLVEEERKHYFLLEHVILFLCQPWNWLENAEFNHLDDF